MKRGLPKLQRAVVRAARKEVRRNKPLWKQYKQLRKRRVSNAGQWVWSLAPLFIMMVYMNSRPEHAMALLALYCTGTIFLRNTALQTSLYQSYEATVFLHLPVSNRAYFHFQSKQAAFKSLFVLVLCLAVYTRAAFSPTDELLLGPVIAAALLQWLIVITLALLLCVYRRGLGAMPGLIVYALGIVSIFSNATGKVVQQIAPFTPSGGVHALFGRLLVGEMLAVAMLLTMAMATAATWLWLRLRQDFPQQELLLTEPYVERDDAQHAGADVATPAVAQDDVAVADEWRRTREIVDLPRAREAVQNFEALQLPLWQAGPIERWASSMLSAREKVLAYFLTGSVQPTWSASWKHSAIATGAGVLFAFVGAPEVLIVIPLVIAAMLGAPVLGGAWSGFTVVPVISQEALLLCSYPVGYFEVSRMIFKANLARIVAWAPLWMMGVAAVGMRYRFEPGDIAGYTLSLLWMVAAVQPFWVMAKFSAGTNDTKRLTWTTALLMVLGIILGIPLVICAVVMLAPVWQTRILAGLGFSAFSTLMWATYGYFYERRAIDCVRPTG